MPRPKRSKKTEPTTAAEDQASAAEESAPEVTEPEVQQAEKVDNSAERQDALEKLQAEAVRREKEIAALRRQLKVAEGARAGVGENGEDFDEKPPPGKFFHYMVTFHPKRNESDDELVSAGVNGNFMVWQRGVETAIRSDFKEVIDNAFTPKFKQLPGEERKEIGGLKPFTYTIHRRISEDEYNTLKAAGDKALKQHLANQGTPV